MKKNQPTPLPHLGVNQSCLTRPAKGWRKAQAEAQASFNQWQNGRMSTHESKIEAIIRDLEADTANTGLINL